MSLACGAQDNTLAHPPDVYPPWDASSKISRTPGGHLTPEYPEAGSRAREELLVCCSRQRAREGKVLRLPEDDPQVLHEDVEL